MVRFEMPQVVTGLVIEDVQQSDDRAAMATRVVDKYFKLDREVVTNLGSSSGATPFEMPRSQIEAEVTARA